MMRRPAQYKKYDSGCHMYVWLTDQPVILSMLRTQRGKDKFFWRISFKTEILIFSSQLRQKNDTRSSSMAAAAAHWLGCFWRHRAVVREKEIFFFFLVMLHRIAHAETTLQHRSHTRPVRVSKTSTYACECHVCFSCISLWFSQIVPNRISLKSLFLTTSFAHRRLSEPWQSETEDICVYAFTVYIWPLTAHIHCLLHIRSRFK